MSNPSVSQVRAWAANAHTLGAAASAIDGKVDDFDNVMNAMSRSVDQVMLDWKGEAARASEAKTLSEKQVGNRLGMGILQITDVLNALAPDFEHNATAAVRAVDDLISMGYIVADNGCVSPPAVPAGGFPSDVPVGATSEEASTIAANNAAQHQAAIQSALRAAGAADAALAGRLNAAADALDAAADRATTAHPVSPEVQSILDGRATLPSDPAALRDLWNSLSANDKAALWNHDRNVANMDGLPAADRDHFNRRHLVEQQNDARADLARLGPPPSGTPDHAPPYRTGRPTPDELNRFQQWRDWHDKYAPLKDRVDALDKLESKINDGGRYQKFLLVNRDDGRAAVAVNNPDTARNVSTYVPGTGTNLSTISGDISRSERMVSAALQADPAPTSVITWSDYNAPQNIFPQAANVDYARSAAGNLDRFQDGLFATHLGDTPSHSSVLGHSYGTTVVSSAATDGHVLNTDDVIMVASPGMDHGANSPSDFNLTGIPSGDMDHRFWSTTSRDDMINAVPEFVLGPKPADGDIFSGGRDFFSDPSGGHSDYFNPRTPSLDNIGAIIADRDDLVTTQAQTGNPAIDAQTRPYG